MLKSVCAALGVFAAGLSAHAQSAAELFGRDAFISDFKMSPSGQVLAFTRRIDGERTIMVQSLVDGKSNAFSSANQKMHGYDFYDEDHIVLFKSVTTTFPGYKGEYEVNGAISLNWQTGRTHQLLTKAKDLLWPQLNLSMIIGQGSEPGSVLMPAWVGPNSRTATFDLFRVDLETGVAREVKGGTIDTIDWFIDDTETLYGREEFSDRREWHKIWGYSDKDWTSLYAEETDIRNKRFIGLSPDRASLLVVDWESEGVNSAAYHMSLTDGSFSAPVFSKTNADISGTLSQDGVVLGVEYSGLQPSYEFYDAKLTSDVAQLVGLFPNSSVEIIDFSDDMNVILISIEGNDHPGGFGFFFRDTLELQLVASARPFLDETGYGLMEKRMVTARDGVTVPTIATYPRGIAPGSEQARNLPTVVLPHGGPESYDRIHFDYMAQFFAHKGYLVIQPNFRGSTGFGYEHRNSGRGKWGLEMQDDVSDALKSYIDSGIANPDKVCIAGASYGGYSALAGGAFTPELYKCVVSIAGVSDLPMMLNRTRSTSGSDSETIVYWERVIGDRKEDKDDLKNQSPANFASAFQAPVLLIHGNDDTVVPIAQTLRMKGSLESAGKSVKFVKLKGGDHWLSTSPTRIETLQAMGDFIDKHLKN